MKLTKIQNKELDSIKNSIEYIEKNIESAYVNLQMAIDLENTKEIKKLNKAIDSGHEEIKKTVKITALSLNIDTVLALDLIFDRDYTLNSI